MKGLLFLVFTLTLSLVNSQVLRPRRDVSSYSRAPTCKQCKPATSCKSEVIVSEVDVPKDVSLPTVEARESVVYKQVPVPDYEIRNKVTTKLVRVPAQTVTFRKNFQDRAPKPMKVRKPLIKYEVAWKDVEVERLVIHEKPVPKDVSVDKVKLVPSVVNQNEPIIVTKRRPVGRPRPEPKSVKIAQSITKEQQRVKKEVRVPTTNYHYCNTERKIYVPNKCGEDISPVIPSSTTQRPTAPPSYIPPKTNNGYSYGGPSSSFQDQAFQIGDQIRLPNLNQDSSSSRFVRQPDPQLPVEETKPQEPLSIDPVKEEAETDLFSANRFGRAISSLLSL